MPRIDRAQWMPTMRHECGHLLVANRLGFSTGGVKSVSGTLGAVIDLQLSAAGC
jgi:hypothetical protein